jgi:hypothetical protein
MIDRLVAILSWKPSSRTFRTAWTASSLAAAPERRGIIHLRRAAGRPGYRCAGL